MRYEFEISRFCHLSIGLIIYALASLNPAFSGEITTGKVLIVNSDSEVEKYRSTEREFIHQLSTQSVQITSQNVNGLTSGEQLEKLISDTKPDLIYSIGSKSFQLANQIKLNQPLLFSSVLNWQRFPQQNKSVGVSNELSLSQELSLMRYLLPKSTRVGVLYDPKFSKQRIFEARAFANEVGISLVEQSLDSPSITDIETAMVSLLPQIDLLWVIADPGVLKDKDSIQTIFSLSEKNNKPIYTYSDAFLTYGASVVVVADVPTISRQVASLAELMLRKENVPVAVQTPAGSHIIVNQCQLNKLKIDINPDALDSVNQLIECK